MRLERVARVARRMAMRFESLKVSSRACVCVSPAARIRALLVFRFPRDLLDGEAMVPA